jgi:hypothetical protein
LYSVILNKKEVQKKKKKIRGGGIKYSQNVNSDKFINAMDKQSIIAGNIYRFVGGELFIGDQSTGFDEKGDLFSF